MSVRTFVILAMVLLTVAWCSGCAALRTPEEITWQGLHAIDAAQTYSTVGSPCLQEVNPVTRELIGAYPSHGEVAAWAIGSSIGHALISDFLLDRGHDRAFRAWQWVTITGTGLTVSNNHRIGIRIGERTSGCP